MCLFDASSHQETAHPDSWALEEMCFVDFDGALQARVGVVVVGGVVSVSALFHAGPVTMRAVPGSYPLLCFDLPRNPGAISRTPH